MSSGPPDGWAATAADLELTVACGPATHRLAWRQGAVVLLDHPDLAAERALVALGGPEPACLTRLGLWRQAVADGGFLAEWVDDAHLSDARLSWLGMALERLRMEGFHEFLRHLPPTRAERMGQFIHRFPRPWLDRAACAVSWAIVEAECEAAGPGPAGPGSGVTCTHAAGLLPQAVAHRLRRAFVDSIGGRLVAWGAAALVPLSITVTAGTGPAVAGTVTGPGRAVALTVGPGWLHQVWGAGAAVVDGHLVLALNPGPAGRSLAQVVTWDRPPAGPDGPQPARPSLQTMEAHHDGRSWRLDAVGLIGMA